MHVAVGQAERRGRNASTLEEESIRIRAGAPRIGFGLDWNLRFCCDLKQPLHDERMVRTAVGNDRPAAEPDITVLGLGAVRNVRAVGHIHDQRHVRSQAVGRHGRTVEAVLLLHGRDRGDAHRRRFGRQLPQGFTRRPHPDAVVAPARGHATILEQIKTIRVGDGIAHPHVLFGLGLGACPDVHIHLVHLRHLFAVVRLLQMNGQ